MGGTAFPALFHDFDVTAPGRPIHGLVEVGDIPFVAPAYDLEVTDLAADAWLDRNRWHAILGIAARSRDDRSRLQNT